MDADPFPYIQFCRALKKKSVCWGVNEESRLGYIRERGLVCPALHSKLSYIDPSQSAKVDKNFYSHRSLENILDINSVSSLSSVISIIYARIMENGTSGTEIFPMALPPPLEMANVYQPYRKRANKRREKDFNQHCLDLTHTMCRLTDLKVRRLVSVDLPNTSRALFF